MKRMLGLLLSLLIVQGCSIYVPHEQAASLPEVLFGPSALVLMNEEATVAGVDGSMTKITKMGSGEITFFYVKGTKTFFMVDSSSFISLWEWDKEKNQLGCVIPKIQPKNALNRMIDSYEVSDDKKFCLIKYWTEQTLNEKMLFTYNLYSIENQKETAFPVTAQEMVCDAWFEHGETDRFFYITREKGKMYSQKKVYWWDTKINESKLLATFEAEEYAYSNFGRWLVIVEDNKLVRYALDTGTTDIIKENVIDIRFSYIGQKPYLFLCEYGTNSTPVCTYMTPEKEWRSFSFYAFDDIENFEVAEENHVVFFTQNQLTKMKSLYKWDSSVNKTSLLHQSKSIKNDFKIIAHPTTKGRYIDIRIQDHEKGGIIILHNLVEGVTKTIEKNTANGIPLSNDGSIWYFWGQKEQSSMVQWPYIYNFKEGKEYPFIMSNSEKFYPLGATNDGRYVVISMDGNNQKNRVIEMVECKEVPFADVDDYQFITWLD